VNRRHERARRHVDEIEDDMHTTRLHDGNPIQWGRDKLGNMRTWFPPIGPKRYPTVALILQRFAAVLFPGVPWQAFAGFCANGEYPWANTTEGVHSQPFHEIGLMGTPAGMRDKPAPDPDPNGRYNTYGKLHAHPDVLRVLVDDAHPSGRPATMVPNAWKTAIADQLAVGFVDVRGNGRSVASMLDPRIRPASESSTWFVALAFAGWSAGPGRAASHVRAHTEALVAVAEADRWATWIRIAAAGPALHKGHENPAYTVARTWQKLEAGRLLSEETGDRCPAWFDFGLDDEHAALCAAIAAKGYGSATSAAPSGTKLHHEDEAVAA
jgi:hypothetical protein